MVKLERMPDEGTIRAFKNKVDFYRNGNLIIARRWPSKPSHIPSADELRHREHFKQAVREWNLLDPFWRASLNLSATRGTFTGRDLHFKYYFGTFPRQPAFAPFVYPYPQVPPFPDPLGTYWSVRNAAVHAHASGEIEYKFKVSSPGYYAMHIHSQRPTFNPFFVKRRGQTLFGHNQAELSSLSYRTYFAQTTTNVFTVPDSWLQANVPPHAPYMLDLKKYGPLGVTLHRGFSPPMFVVAPGYNSPATHDSFKTINPLYWPPAPWPFPVTNYGYTGALWQFNLPLAAGNNFGSASDPVPPSD